MSDESPEQSSKTGKPRVPFILRLTSGVLKKFASGLMIFCLASAVLTGGFTLVSLTLGLMGTKPLDVRLIAMGVFTTLVFCLFARWCIRIRDL